MNTYSYTFQWSDCQSCINRIGDDTSLFYRGFSDGYYYYNKKILIVAHDNEPGYDQELWDLNNWEKNTIKTNEKYIKIYKTNEKYIKIYLIEFGNFKMIKRYVVKDEITNPKTLQIKLF